MIGDLTKLLLPNAANTKDIGTPKELTGTLAKLSSEIKLIEGLHLIKVTNSKDLVYQQKPVQLLEISTQSNKSLSIINAQSKIDAPIGQTLTLTVDNKTKSATLNLPQATQMPSAKPTEQGHSNALQTNNGKSINSANRPPLQPVTNATNHSAGHSSNPPTPANTESIKIPVSIASKIITLTVTATGTPLNETTPNKTAMANSKTTANPARIEAPQTISHTPATINQADKISLQTNPSIAATKHALASTNVATSFLVEVSDGEHNFTLKMPHSPAIGSQLNVMLDAKGQLQMLPPTQPTPNSPAEEAIKQSLPKQLSTQEMTRLVTQLQMLADADPKLTEKITSALKQLVQSFPNLASLSSAESIKQSFQQSGLFLEKNLATQSPNLEQDLKLNLLKLQTVAGEDKQTKFPPQFELITKAIERITTHQLKHLVDNVRSETQILPLHIEIPIRSGQSTSLVRFEIDREADATEKLTKEQRHWLVKLRFDFPETGKIETRLSIQENKAGIIFVAEAPETELKIRNNLNEIRQSLRDKGISIERLDCFCAPLVDKEAPKLSNRLIDVRT